MNIKMKNIFASIFIAIRQCTAQCSLEKCFLFTKKVVGLRLKGVKNCACNKSIMFTTTWCRNVWIGFEVKLITCLEVARWHQWKTVTYFESLMIPLWSCLTMLCVLNGQNIYCKPYLFLSPVASVFLVEFPTLGTQYLNVNYCLLC